MKRVFVAALVFAACRSQPSAPPAPADLGPVPTTADPVEAFLDDLNRLVALDDARPRPLHDEPAPGAVAGEWRRAPACQALDHDGACNAWMYAWRELVDGDRSPERMTRAQRDHLAACDAEVDSFFRAGRAETKPALTVGTPADDALLHRTGRVLRPALARIRALAASPQHRDEAADRCLDVLAHFRDTVAMDVMRAVGPLGFLSSTSNVCAAALLGASPGRRERAMDQLGRIAAGLPVDELLHVRGRVEEALVVLGGRWDEAVIGRSPPRLHANLRAMRREALGVIPPFQLGPMFGASPLSVRQLRRKHELATVLSMLRAGLAARRFREANGVWPSLAQLGPMASLDARPRGAVRLEIAGERLVLVARAPRVAGADLQDPTTGDFIVFGRTDQNEIGALDEISLTVTPDGASPRATETAAREARRVEARDALLALVELIRRAPASPAPAPEAADDLIAALEPWLRGHGFTRAHGLSDRPSATWTRQISPSGELRMHMHEDAHGSLWRGVKIGLEWARPGSHACAVDAFAGAPPELYEEMDRLQAEVFGRRPPRYTREERETLAIWLEVADTPGRPLDVRLPPGLTREGLLAALSTGTVPAGASVRLRLTGGPHRPGLLMETAADAGRWRSLLTRALPGALEVLAEETYAGAEAPPYNPP